jgi:hypothetical protein
MAGRPSSYTEEIADRICQGVADGKSLNTICKSHDDMPTITTIFRWLADDRYSAFRDKYTRAKRDQAESGFERITEIVQQVIDGEIDPNTARVAIDAIKWQLGKLKPNKYSDKIQIDQDHNININVIKYTTNETPPKRVEHDPKLID